MFTQEMLEKVDSILDSFAHFGVDLGLERIERLLADLGQPQNQVSIVHVAGSNGKGSVCAYLSSVLTEAGYRVGRYISPHLIDWTERITINQQPIAPDVLYALLLQVLAAISPNAPSPTQFEVITAAAWLYFAQQQVDIAVIEVGLGGRLDATNVCEHPLVSIITSLSREHWQRLGPTLADISREKAGILKPGCPAVIAPLPPEAIPVIHERLAALGCPAVFPQPAQNLGNGWAAWQEPIATPAPSTHSILRYRLPLPGQHQLINSSVAIAALDLLRKQGWNICDRDIVNGIAKTQWMGRLQWLTWKNQTLLIDGAHNPAGATMLRRYVDTSKQVSRPIQWVMGLLANKDHADIFQALLRPGDRLSLVPVPEHLSADLSALATLSQTICPELSDCCIYEDVFTALQSIPSPATASSTTVLCGSLYLIGHFLKHAKD